MKSRRRLLLPSLLVACVISAPCFAGDKPPQPANAGDSAQDPFALDLESLLNMKVTTASKFSEKLSDAPGVMSVVTKDELQRFGGLTLSEILERVPGLAGSAASFTDRSLVAARGDQTKINGGHILFLINGRPTREILEGGLIGDLLESFPVNILERIEVIRGPGSVLYGSNAFSAVVNLITQKAETNEVVVTGLGGEAQGVDTSGQVMFRHNDLSIVGAGQFHQKPTWLTSCWTEYAGLQSVAIADRGKGSYLGVNYKGLSFMSSYTEWTTAYNEGFVGNGRWRRNFADLGYNLKASAKWDMNFNLTYTRATLDAVKSIPFIDRVSQEAVLEWSNVFTISDQDRLTFGGLYNYIQGTENFYGTGAKMPISDGSRPGGAFNGQMDHELMDNLKLIGGFQANKIGSLKLNIVPRAGVIWSPAARISVKTLYSGAFRAPSINETLLNYVPPPAIGGPSLLGNRYLAPEKVATIDLGLSYQGNRFQAGADYFHSKQTDNIVLDVTNGTYVNLGRAIFQGVELEGKYYFKKSLFLTGSALYQTNHDGDGHKNVTPIANVGAKGGVSYEAARGFTASLFDVYQGHVPGYSLALNPRPEASHLIDANLRYDLSRRLHLNTGTAVALVAHATNLANQTVWLPDWKDRPGDSIFSDRGRNISLGVEVSFKKD